MPLRRRALLLKRADAGYTPPGDVTTRIRWWCTDDRQWVQRGLFQEGGYGVDEDGVEDEDEKD